MSRARPKRPRPARRGDTLYDARHLDARLAKLPPAYRDLFRDAYIGTRKLRARAEAPGEAPPGLFELVDDLCANWVRQARPACDSGCAWCCRQDVLMAPFEFAAIRDAIEAQDIAGVVGRKLADADRGPSILVDGRTLPVSDCPLLDDDQRCMVYAARPIACRTQFAMDAGKCRAAFEAARAGDANATYQRAGDPAVVGIAAREAVQATKRVFLRDMLREYLADRDA